MCSVPTSCRCLSPSLFGPGRPLLTGPACFFSNSYDLINLTFFLSCELACCWKICARVWCQLHAHGPPACWPSSRTPANRDPARRWLSRPLNGARSFFSFGPTHGYPRPDSSLHPRNVHSFTHILRCVTARALPSLVPGLVPSAFVRFQSLDFAGYNTLKQRTNAAKPTSSVGASRDTIAPSIWIHVSGQSPAANPSRSDPYLLIQSLNPTRGAHSVHN
jgi:hypothetical protein